MSTKRYENNNANFKTKKIIGVVTDCLKLNIRQRPYRDSEVVTIVTCLDKLNIDIEASTNDWYAVSTTDGIEGFCMKKFIVVGQ